MASYKDTFEPNTFEANTFACGTWRGAGVDIVAAHYHIIIGASEEYYPALASDSLHIVEGATEEYHVIEGSD